MDVLSLLQAYNDANTSDVWIPSTNETIKFRPILAKHQQELLKRLGESSFELAAFSLAVSDMIKDTATVPIDINQYTASDKVAIALQLRMHNISPTVGATLTSESLALLGEHAPASQTVQVDIASHIEHLKAAQPPIPNVEPVNDGTVRIELGIPSMADELTYVSIMVDAVNAAKVANPEAAKAETLIGDLVLATLTTYINQITINNRTISFSDCAGSLRMSYVRVLSRKLIDACAVQIQELSAYSEVFVKSSQNVNNVDVIAIINVDARMFAES